MSFLAILAINFHSGGFTMTTFCFKRHFPSKIWKKQWYCLFLYYFHNIGHNLAQILPQDHTWFDFFAGFQWSMLGNSINIKNFNWNPVVLKNLLRKPLKITIFLPDLCKNVPMGHIQNKKTIFYSETTKPDNQSIDN